VSEITADFLYLRWLGDRREIPAYDWARARYVLSLGSGILDSSCQLVAFSRAQAGMRRGLTGARAKIVDDAFERLNLRRQLSGRHPVAAVFNREG
jgi:hypothetical protein